MIWHEAAAPPIRCLLAARNAFAAALLTARSAPVFPLPYPVSCVRFRFW